MLYLGCLFDLNMSFSVAALRFRTRVGDDMVPEEAAANFGGRVMFPWGEEVEVVLEGACANSVVGGMLFWRTDESGGADGKGWYDAGHWRPLNDGFVICLYLWLTRKLFGVCMGGENVDIDVDVLKLISGNGIALKCEFARHSQLSIWTEVTLVMDEFHQQVVLLHLGHIRIFIPTWSSRPHSQSKRLEARSSKLEPRCTS